MRCIALPSCRGIEQLNGFEVCRKAANLPCWVESTRCKADTHGMVLAPLDLPSHILDCDVCPLLLKV